MISMQITTGFLLASPARARLKVLVLPKAFGTRQPAAPVPFFRDTVLGGCKLPGCTIIVTSGYVS